MLLFGRKAHAVLGRHDVVVGFALDAFLPFRRVNFLRACIRKRGDAKVNIVKKLMAAVAAGVLAIFFLVIVFADNGLMELRRKRGELNQTVRKNLRIETENIALLKEIDRLKNDMNYVEEVARKELGVIGDNEVVVKFKGAKK